MTEMPAEYAHLPEKQRKAIQWALDVAALSDGAKFAPEGYEKVAEIIYETTRSGHYPSGNAKNVLNDWRESLARPEEIAAVHHIDGAHEVGPGAITLQDEGGFWISTWTFVSNHAPVTSVPDERLDAIADLILQRVKQKLLEMVANIDAPTGN